VGANSLCFPNGLAVDGSSLFIADTQNSRVLEFDDPLLNGTSPDAVLGQVDFPFAGINEVKAGGLAFPGRGGA
jgi:hypothetical protein